MASNAITTIVKMLESIPESEQERVAEHLREYLADLHDEEIWDDLYNRTKPKLTEAAQRVRREISEGKAKPLDHDDL